MKKSLFIMALSLLMLGCTSKPVLNLEQVQVPSFDNGKNQTIETVQSAIVTGAKRRGWSAQVVEPGVIIADLSVRSHRAKVTIEYDESAYSIHYRDSSNLNYNDGYIHRNYNNWVLKLSRTIQQEMNVNIQRY